MIMTGASPVAAGSSGEEVKQVDIHDPAVAKDGDTYFLFSSGPGITFYRSKDLRTWKLEGRVFPGDPSWAKSIAPLFNGHVWAPDIVLRKESQGQHDGKFYLYYSVSSWGQNSSAIGLTINKTLHQDSPDYKWEDQGPIVRSVPNRDLWNGIDPAIMVDEEGTPWMGLGSFWGGLKLVKLDASWKKLAEPQEWYSIAKRERSVLVDDRQAGPAEIEGPFLFKKGDYYYLFVSWGLCARGKNSTYRMVMGRSKDVRGPYLDKEGKDMAKGGGTLVIKGNERWAGWGGNSAYTFDGKDYIVFHAYENADNDFHRLKIGEITWDEEQWPVVDERILDEYIGIEVE
jgi:arabinan endo-1,5-alpha-L-arabinosidase